MKYKTQDSKFYIENNRLVGQSGEVPADEPLFILRGRDVNAIPVLYAYLKSCTETGVEPSHIEAVAKRIGEFAAFRSQNHGRMKRPDTNIAELHDRDISPTQTAKLQEGGK